MLKMEIAKANTLSGMSSRCQRSCRSNKKNYEIPLSKISL